jgi:hypothetical protein
VVERDVGTDKLVAFIVAKKPTRTRQRLGR